MGFVDAVPIFSNTDGRRISAYIAGYILKKLVGSKQKCLPGIVPEYQVMSKGLGYDYMDLMAARLKNANVKPYGYDGVAIEHDLQMIRIDGKLYPLSRSMRDRLRKAWGPDPRSELSKQIRQNFKAFRDDILRETEEYEKEENERRHKAAKILKGYVRSRIDTSEGEIYQARTEVLGGRQKTQEKAPRCRYKIKDIEAEDGFYQVGANQPESS